MSCLFYLSCQIYCPFNIFWICSYVTSSFLILIICVFSFFFLICLARDLADVSVVSKKQLLVSFPLFSFLVDWLPHLTVLFPIFLLTLCFYSEKFVLKLHNSSQVLLNSPMQSNVLGSKICSSYSKDCLRIVKGAY